MKMLCPHCGVKGAADDSYIGKMVKCPKCQVAFKVSSEGEFELDARSAIEARDDGVKLKILCPHCGIKGAVKGSYVGKVVKCPKCEVPFEVPPEGKTPLPEKMHILAGSPPVEPAPPGIENEYSSTIPAGEDSTEEPVSDLSADASLEDKFSQDPVEVSEWSEVADETVQDSAIVEEITAPRNDVASTLRARGFQGNDPELLDPSSALPVFSITGVIKEAWQETKGAKASVWAGSGVMYLVMLVAGLALTFLVPFLGLDMTTMTGMIINTAFQGLLTIVSLVFTAGLLYMGVRKVAGEAISWKMIFTGFSFTGQIILATILQAIFVGLGLLLLVLPGIYLAIGYGLTLPLILDQEMSAWQAMEASRKAIHKVWWKVTGALFLMALIYTVSALPLGIGLIWTVPMFIVLGGVIYRCLFEAGAQKK